MSYSDDDSTHSGSIGKPEVDKIIEHIRYPEPTPNDIIENRLTTQVTVYMIYMR